MGKHNILINTGNGLHI